MSEIVATIPVHPLRQWLWPIVTLVLLALAAVVSWFGIATGARAPDRAESFQAEAVSGPIHRIALPSDDPDCPPGPHRVTFQTACTVCHSTRLVVTQPLFPAKKWGEIVKKMIATYGAPIGPAEEEHIVAYLGAVRGK